MVGPTSVAGYPCRKLTGFRSVPIIRHPKPKIAERPGRGRGDSASAAEYTGGTLRVMAGGFGDLILMCASLLFSEVPSDHSRIF